MLVVISGEIFTHEDIRAREKHGSNLYFQRCYEGEDEGKTPFSEYISVGINGYYIGEGEKGNARAFIE